MMLLLPKSLQPRLVEGSSHLLPLYICSGGISSAFLQRCFEGFTWRTLGLGVMHLAWDKGCLGADEDVVHVAVGTVHTSGFLQVVQVSTLGQDHA